MPHDNHVQFAAEAVRQAALLVRQIQAEMVTPAITKQDRSPVTVADFAAQALIAQRLSESFPGDVLVAEESTGALLTPDGEKALEQVTQFVGRKIANASRARVCEWIERGTAEPSDAFWTLDPVDGTKGFLRGDQYAVALARIENGSVTIAALGCPGMTPQGIAAADAGGVLVLAARGQGCRAAPLAGGDFHPWRASECRELAQARMLRSVESGHTNTDQTGRLAEELGLAADSIAMDSQAKYAALASGGAEILVRLLSPGRPDYRELIWDQAAGSLIVEEAGGRVTDLDGQPLDFSTGRTLARNRGVLATSGPIHDRVLQALAAIGA
ncbi:MAG: 3'(2'),5'-bisphosphate nucleotidase [Pirellulales bacterium]